MSAAPHVLIPVNRLERAKGRLGTLLDPAARAALARSTLATALHAALGAGLAVTVLSADAALAPSLPPGVRFLREHPAARGLNAQLTDALAHLEARSILILHADLPLASAAALRALIAAALPSPSATLVESGDGGTNAMLLRPAGQFALAYGPRSAARHRAAATRAGLPVSTVSIPALALDLDTPGDIRSLLATPEGRGSAAGALLLGL